MSQRILPISWLAVYTERGRGEIYFMMGSSGRQSGYCSVQLPESITVLSLNAISQTIFVMQYTCKPVLGVCYRIGAVELSI